MEMLGGTVYVFAKRAADKESIDYVTRVTGRKYNDISQAKMFYLKGWLEKESLHVGETVKNINLAIGLIENDGYFFSPRQRALSDLVFSHSASARIISLFIALSAIILTLSVRNGANLEYFFAFYDMGFWRVAGLYAMVMILVVGCLFFSARTARTEHWLSAMADGGFV